MTETAVPTYAILFKTHFWDDFTRRQLARLSERSKHGRLFVVVDETAGPVRDIESDAVIRLNETRAIEYGLADAKTEDSLFWYNVDYCHYIAFDQHPDYDYYLTIEYDVALNLDIDELISAVARQRVDYVGHPITKPKYEWPWFKKHLKVYEEKDIVLALSCVAVFSNRAMRLLRQRRLDMTRQFQAGDLTFWPNNEAFLPTEIQLAGMRSKALSDYGNASRYDWWPPTYEGDLAAMPDEAFVHPVLAGARYVRSVLRHEPNLLTVFLRKSVLRSRLAKVPADVYRPFIAKEFRRRLKAAADRRLARVGLARDWTHGAETSKAALKQT